MTIEEREELRKRNVDQQRAYRERNLKQLEEQRNQFLEQQGNKKVGQQRQYSTNKPVEPTMGDYQHAMVREQRVDNISIPSEEMYTRHRKFRERIDQLAEFQVCHVCQESYVGIKVHNSSTDLMCMRCLRERSDHRFSAMD